MSSVYPVDISLCSRYALGVVSQALASGSVLLSGVAYLQSLEQN